MGCSFYELWNFPVDVRVLRHNMPYPTIDKPNWASVTHYGQETLVCSEILDSTMVGLSKLIERLNCSQLNVQSVNGSLQNAFLEAVNDKMVQTCVNSENGLGSRFRL